MVVGLGGEDGRKKQEAMLAPWGPAVSLTADGDGVDKINLT